VLKVCFLVGSELPRVKRTSGFRALDMVLKYAHLVPDQKREKVVRLERAFGGGANEC